MEEESTFQMKQTASSVAQRSFFSLLNIDPMPLSSCWEVIQKFFADSDVIESWTTLLNHLEKNGEFYLNKEQMRDFKADAIIQMRKMFTYEVDPMSRLFGMSSLTDPETTHWSMRFPDCLVSNFKIEGTFGVIEGLPRSGKTSLAVSFAEILGEVFHQEIITNIVVKDPPEYYHIVRNVSGLIKEMINAKKFVCLLDETAIYIPKKRALSGENIDFESLARFIGKWRGSLIVISHSFLRDIPSLLQEWTTEKYKKIDLDKCQVQLSKRGGYVKMYRLITGIPNCRLEFVTEDTTALTFDISVTKLLNEIQDVENYLDKPARILQWLTDELQHQQDKQHKGVNEMDQYEQLVNDIQALKDEHDLNTIQAVSKYCKKHNANYSTTITKYYKAKNIIEAD